jgi:transcriptional regulator with XRE-family HTH domain
MNGPEPNPARERHWVCAQRIRARRLTLGLTQREVVERLERRGNHTTNRTLSAMENGRGLDLGLLPELAGSLDCTITYLLGLAADPHSWHPDQWPRADDRMPRPIDRPIDRQIDRPAAEQRRTPGVLRPEVPNGSPAPGRQRRRHFAVDSPAAMSREAAGRGDLS